VTEADLDRVEPSFKDRLNVRYAKKNGVIVPEVYKIGGLYGREIETIVHFLELAVPYASSAEQKKSIEVLIEYYRSGNEDDFRRHTIHWLKSDGDVDYLNGFIEVYLDPRGIIGQFEANVNIKAGDGLIDELADNALYFERRMPWPDKYKRDQINRPVANVVNALIETGDAGPISPAAYNLPNYNDLRRDHGSKNVILHNIEYAWSKELHEKTVDEFYLPEYRENVKLYERSITRPLEVYMHEIIGHGSGQPDDKLDHDPRTLLGRVYSALEECRADLVALYHIADPKLIELGAFTLREQKAIVETSYITALQGWFSRFDRVPDLIVREAHNKGSHTIFSYLLESGGDENNDFGVEVIEKGGDYFVRLNDLESIRNGIADLLRKIQIIKSKGDREAAEKLFDRFGTQLNPEWKANVTARKQKLNMPKIKSFVFPRLKPVLADGELVDVEIHNDEDLTAQQLRFSRLEYSTEIDES
jgi:dipeptidyl-peptidase-3